MSMGGEPMDGRAVSRFIRIELREIGDLSRGEVVVEGRAPVSDHLRGPGGGLRAGALLTMIDNAGGICGGLASLPNGWVVSTNIAVRTSRLATHGPLRLLSRVLRAGRRAVVTETRVTDEGAGAALIAHGTLTSAVLMPEGGPPAWPRPAFLAAGPEPGDDAPPLLEWLGMRSEATAEGAVVTIELADDLRNPWGILHGGITATLADVAGEHAVTAVTGAPAATVDTVLHYLSPGRVGPVRATARRLGRRADGHVVRIEIDDLGAGRLMSVATTTVRGLA